jgi:hypothetical protein
MGEYSYKGREKVRREIHLLARTRDSVCNQCHSGSAPIAVDAWISPFRRPLIFGFLSRMQDRLFAEVRPTLSMIEGLDKSIRYPLYLRD